MRFKTCPSLSCLAGNVGIPYSSCVLDNDLLHRDGYDVVLEMSNFQLLDIEKFHPHISTIINLTQIIWIIWLHWMNIMLLKHVFI